MIEPGRFLDPPGALVDFRQVRIEIARVALARGHVAAQHRHFAQGFGIGGHVGHHHQHVIVEVESEIFGGGKCRARGEQALDDRFVGEVQEDDHLVQDAALFEAFLKESGIGMRGAEGGEDDDEFGRVVAQQLGLTHDLRRDPVMRQAAAGENRQFLAAGQGIHAVDGGNAGLDEFARVGAGGGVERLAVHVATVGGNDRRSSVARQSGAVEHAAEDVARNGQLERLVRGSAPRCVRDPVRRCLRKPRPAPRRRPSG